MYVYEKKKSFVHIHTYLLDKFMNHTRVILLLSCLMKFYNDNDDKKKLSSYRYKCLSVSLKTGVGKRMKLSSHTCVCVCVYLTYVHAEVGILPNRVVVEVQNLFELSPKLGEMKIYETGENPDTYDFYVLCVCVCVVVFYFVVFTLRVN